MKIFDKITKSKLFQKRSATILLSIYAIVIGGTCVFAKVAVQNSEDASLSTEDISVIEQTTGIDAPKELKKDEDNKKDIEEARESTEDRNASSHSKPSKKPSGSSSSKRVWVEPVYKTVEHPAQTRKEKVVVGYRCMCGREFATTGDYQAHRPVPCDGKHSAYDPIYEIRTVVIKEAWTEQVLVKEGYWKEG